MKPPSGSKNTNPNKPCPELVPKVRSRMGQFQTGQLTVNRMKRKQSQKDFPDFFEKLPFMVLTNAGK